MTKPFSAPQTKIDRARRHLQELRSEIDDYFRRGGAQVIFETAQEFASAGEMGAFTYREKESIPIAWSAIIGDVLHNLRSSLDLLACDLHRMTGGNPEHISGVHYPFCKSKADLTRTIKERRLKHIGSAFLKVIERTAPYHGGNDGLRAIHDLNILDKHQALVPTISIVSVDWPVKIAQGSQQFVTGLTKDGQRLIVFPRAFCPLLPGSRIKANFSIIFGDVGIFRSTDVVKQLEACIVSVEAILKEFQAAGNERTAGSSQQLSQRDL